MKTLRFLLAFYLLCLTLLPCADKQAMHQDEVVVGAVAHSDSNHSCGGEEICSPMCVCSCCAGFTFENQYFALKAEPIANETKIMPVSASFHSMFNSSIWQPPQI